MASSPVTQTQLYNATSRQTAVGANPAPTPSPPDPSTQGDQQQSIPSPTTPVTKNVDPAMVGNLSSQQQSNSAIPNADPSSPQFNRVFKDPALAQQLRSQGAPSILPNAPPPQPTTDSGDTSQQALKPPGIDYSFHASELQGPQARSEFGSQINQELAEGHAAQEQYERSYAEQQRQLAETAKAQQLQTISDQEVKYRSQGVETYKTPDGRVMPKVGRSTPYQDTDGSWKQSVVSPDGSIQTVDPDAGAAWKPSATADGQPALIQQGKYNKQVVPIDDVVKQYQAYQKDPKDPSVTPIINQMPQAMLAYRQSQIDNLNKQISTFDKQDNGATKSLKPTDIIKLQNQLKAQKNILDTSANPPPQATKSFWGGTSQQDQDDYNNSVKDAQAQAKDIQSQLDGYNKRKALVEQSQSFNSLKGPQAAKFLYQKYLQDQENQPYVDSSGQLTPQAQKDFINPDGTPTQKGQQQQDQVNSQLQTDPSYNKSAQTVLSGAPSDQIQQSQSVIASKTASANTLAAQNIQQNDPHIPNSPTPGVSKTDDPMTAWVSDLGKRFDRGSLALGHQLADTAGDQEQVVENVKNYTGVSQAQAVVKRYTGDALFQGVVGALGPQASAIANSDVLAQGLHQFSDYLQGASQKVQTNSKNDNTLAGSLAEQAPGLLAVGASQLVGALTRTGSALPAAIMFAQGYSTTKDAILEANKSDTSLTEDQKQLRAKGGGYAGGLVSGGLGLVFGALGTKMTPLVSKTVSGLAPNLAKALTVTPASALFGTAVNAALGLGKGVIRGDIEMGLMQSLTKVITDHLTPDTDAQGKPVDKSLVSEALAALDNIGVNSLCSGIFHVPEVFHQGARDIQSASVQQQLTQTGAASKFVQLVSKSFNAVDNHPDLSPEQKAQAKSSTLSFLPEDTQHLITALASATSGHTEDALKATLANDPNKITDATARLQSAVEATFKASKTPEGIESLKQVNDFNNQKAMGDSHATVLDYQTAQTIAPRGLDSVAVKSYLPIAQETSRLAPEQQTVAQALFKLVHGRALDIDDRTALSGDEQYQKTKNTDEVKGTPPVTSGLYDEKSGEITNAGLNFLRSNVPSSDSVIPRTATEAIESKESGSASPTPLPTEVQAPEPNSHLANDALGETSALQKEQKTLEQAHKTIQKTGAQAPHGIARRHAQITQELSNREHAAKTLPLEPPKNEPTKRIDTRSEKISSNVSSEPSQIPDKEVPGKQEAERGNSSAKEQLAKKFDKASYVKNFDRVNYQKRIQKVEEKRDQTQAALEEAKAKQTAAEQKVHTLKVEQMGETPRGLIERNRKLAEAKKEAEFHKESAQSLQEEVEIHQSDVDQFHTAYAHLHQTSTDEAAGHIQDSLDKGETGKFEGRPGGEGMAFLDKEGKRVHKIYYLGDGDVEGLHIQGMTRQGDEVHFHIGRGLNSEGHLEAKLDAAKQIPGHVPFTIEGRTEHGEAAISMAYLPDEATDTDVSEWASKNNAIKLEKGQAKGIHEEYAHDNYLIIGKDNNPYLLSDINDKNFRKSETGDTYLTDPVARKLTDKDIETHPELKEAFEKAQNSRTEARNNQPGEEQSQGISKQTGVSGEVSKGQRDQSGAEPTVNLKPIEGHPEIPQESINREVEKAPTAKLTAKLDLQTPDGKQKILDSLHDVGALFNTKLGLKGDQAIKVINNKSAPDALGVAVVESGHIALIVNLDKLSKQASIRSTEKGDSSQWVKDAIGEETIHLADVYLKRQDWISQGSKGDFKSHIAKLSKEDLKGFRVALMAGNKSVARALVDSIRLYDSSVLKVDKLKSELFQDIPDNDLIEKAKGVLDHLETNPSKRFQVFGEVVRQLVQAKRDGTLTESGYHKVTGKIVEWLKKMVQVMKNLASDPHMASLIKPIEDVLDQLKGETTEVGTKVPDKKSPEQLEKNYRDAEPKVQNSKVDLAAQEKSLDHPDDFDNIPNHDPNPLFDKLKKLFKLGQGDQRGGSTGIGSRQADDTSAKAAADGKKLPITKSPDEFRKLIDTSGFKPVDLETFADTRSEANRRRKKREVEAAQVLALAKQHGFLLSHDSVKAIQKGKDFGGFEHEVYADPKSDRVFKITRNGSFGINSDLSGYLKRLDTDQLITPVLDPKIHGVYRDDDGQFRVVTSQAFIKGDVPTEPEINSYLTARGWEKSPGGAYGWTHSDGIEMIDAHSGNFIKTGDGHLVPIDVHYIGEPKQMFGKNENQLNAGEKEESRIQEALNEEPGKQTIGDPARANWGDTQVARRSIDALQSLYSENKEAQSFKQWQEKADEIASKAPLHELADYLINKANDPAKGLNTASEVMLAKKITPKLLADPNYRTKAFDLIYANLRNGSETGRALAAHVDPYKTPKERHAEFLGKLIASVSPEDQAKINAVSDPKEKAALAAKLQQARYGRIVKALSKMGITPDDIFSGEAKVRLQGAKFVQDAIGQFKTAGQRKANRMILDGYSDKEIMKESGLVQAQLDDLRAQFDQALRAKIEKFVDRGLTVNDVEAMTGEELDKLGAGEKALNLPKDAGERERRIQEILDKLRPNKDVANSGKLRKVAKENVPITQDSKGNKLKGPVDADGKPWTKAKKQGKKTEQEQHDEDTQYRKAKFDERSVRDVIRAGRVMSTANSSNLSRIHEYWQNAILSGPQTHVAIGLGTGLNAGLEFGLQRPVEAIINNVIGNKDGATFSELAPVAKAFLPALAKGALHAYHTFNEEHDFFNEDLNRTLKVDEAGNPIDTTEFKGGTHGPKIPGTTGRIIRIPMRAITALDSFLRNTIGHMDVAAQAHRSGLVQGLKDDELTKHIEKEMANPKSESWAKAYDNATNEIGLHGPLPSAFHSLSAYRNTADAKNFADGMSRFVVAQFFPFLKVPYNLTRIGLRKSPLGSVPLIYQLAAATAQAVQSSPGARLRTVLQTNPKLIRNLAEQFIAWGAVSLIKQFTEGDSDDDQKEFLITGPRYFGEGKQGEKELLDRTSGGPTTMRFGTRANPIAYINYGRYEPIATVLGTIVDGARGLKTGTRDHINEAETIAQGLAGQLKASPFMQGISNILDITDAMLSKNYEGMPKALEQQFVQSWVPNIFRQPVRNWDSVNRDSKFEYPVNAKDFGDMNKVANLLGYTQGDPAQHDLYGNETTKTGLSPLRTLFPSSINPTPKLELGDTLLSNWNRAHQDSTSYFPERPNKTFYEFKVPGKPNVSMTPVQIATFDKLAGKALEQKLSGWLTPSQAKNPTEDDIKEFKKSLEEARKEAKDILQQRYSMVNK